MSRTKTQSRKKTKVAKCLRCNKPASSRGLCHADYMVLFRAVESGETTFAKAEAAGACLPVAKVGRKPKKFSERFPELTRSK